LLNDRAMLTKPLRFAMQPADHFVPEAGLHQNEPIDWVGHPTVDAGARLASQPHPWAPGSNS